MHLFLPNENPGQHAARPRKHSVNNYRVEIVEKKRNAPKVQTMADGSALRRVCLGSRGSAKSV